MESRKTIDEKLKFKIGRDTVESYKKPWTWKDLLETEGLLPTDTVYNFAYIEELENGFGKMDDNLETFYYPVIEIIRPRPETDEEFLKRKQTEETAKKQQDEKDKLEYLRLKAKFETE